MRDIAMRTCVVCLAVLVDLAPVCLGTVSRSVSSQGLLDMKAYTEKLLQKTMQDPEPNHNLTITSQEQAAIDSIKTFIQNMYANQLASFEASKKEAQQKCPDEYTNCYTVAFTNELTSLNTKQEAVNNTRTIHSTCRDALQPLNATKITKCNEYHNHRKSDTNAYPECGLEGSKFVMTEANIECEGDPSGGCSQTAMENCLVEIYNWYEGIYPKYWSCRDYERQVNVKDDECDDDQDDFEQASCTYTTAHDSQCSGYYGCLTQANTTCESFCDTLEVELDARIADNSTGEYILCLLDVFEVSNDQKPGKLQECKDKDYNNSADFQIACPPLPMSQYDPVAIPVYHVACRQLSAPCEPAWVTAENYAEYLDSGLDECYEGNKCPRTVY